MNVVTDGGREQEPKQRKGKKTLIGGYKRGRRERDLVNHDVVGFLKFTKDLRADNESWGDGDVIARGRRARPWELEQLFSILQSPRRGQLVIPEKPPVLLLSRLHSSSSS